MTSIKNIKAGYYISWLTHYVARNKKYILGQGVYEGSDVDNKDIMNILTTANRPLIVKLSSRTPSWISLQRAIESGKVRIAKDGYNPHNFGISLVMPYIPIFMLMNKTGNYTVPWSKDFSLSNDRLSIDNFSNTRLDLCLKIVTLLHLLSDSTQREKNSKTAIDVMFDIFEILLKTKRIKSTESIPRLIGLFLWDTSNEIGRSKAVKLFNELYHSQEQYLKYLFVDGYYGETELHRLINKTNTCIEKMDVLPISS